MGRLMVVLDPGIKIGPIQPARAWGQDDEALAVGVASVERAPWRPVRVVALTAGDTTPPDTEPCAFARNRARDEAERQAKRDAMRIVLGARPPARRAGLLAARPASCPRCRAVAAAFLEH
jgi:hypothetical protein